MLRSPEGDRVGCPSRSTDTSVWLNNDDSLFLGCPLKAVTQITKESLTFFMHAEKQHRISLYFFGGVPLAFWLCSDEVSIKISSKFLLGKECCESASA